MSLSRRPTREMPRVSPPGCNGRWSSRSRCRRSRAGRRASPPAPRQSTSNKGMARIRVVTLNMEQDRKRWELRRELIAEQLVALKPDLLALNEVCVPLQTARWLQGVAKARMGVDYALVQQTKVN